MISKLHARLGTAGLVVAVIALVAALAGTAFAAAGLSSKQKQEVKTIARQFAGKNGATGPAGPAGAKGDTGLVGAKGDTGAAGATGPQGPAGPTGADGAQGPEGPAGPAGSPWTVGNVLPSGATEVGTWADAVSGFDVVPISWSIPLGKFDPTKFVIVQEGEANPSCDDGVSPAASAENPEADPGFLCVFVGFFESGVEGEIAKVLKPGVHDANHEPVDGYGRTGAGLELFSRSFREPDIAAGSFAVTAE